MTEMEKEEVLTRAFGMSMEEKVLTLKGIEDKLIIDEFLNRYDQLRKNNNDHIEIANRRIPW